MSLSCNLLIFQERKRKERGGEGKNRKEGERKGKGEKGKEKERKGGISHQGNEWQEERSLQTEAHTAKELDESAQIHLFSKIVGASPFRTAPLVFHVPQVHKHVIFNG